VVSDLAARRDLVFALVGDWFRRVYTPPGRLAVFAVDGRSGTPAGGKDLLPELADYLPLLAAAGHRDYVVAQGEIVRRRLANGTIVANPDRGLFPWLPRANPFYYGDLILGLLECHALGLGEWWLEEARRQLDLVLRLFRRGDALVKEVTLRGSVALPVAESNALLVVELLLELDRLSGGNEHLALAESLLSPWQALAEPDGAVPQLRLLHPLLRLWPRLAARRRSYPLYKHNLGYLAALVALAEARADAESRRRAVAAVERSAAFFRGPDGVFRATVQRVGAQRATGPATLKATLLAELLCDLAVAWQRPDLLPEAERQCRFWLERRVGATGLIPYRLDSPVTLLKLFAATRDESYRRAASELLLAMLAHHEGEFGLVRSVDARDGSVRDALVETRFCSLFLKPWLVASEVESLYAKPALLSLVRDR
jgi:hypothetical protein